MAADDPDHALNEEIRAERVRFVFVQSAIPIFFSPLAASILAFALWKHIDHRFLLFWAAGTFVIAVGRVLLIRSFPRTPTEAAVRRWERIFVASIVLVDLWWGVGGLFLLVPDALAQRALVFCFLMMMAGGHAASYSAHPATVVLGVLALTLPITVVFGLRPDVFHRTMAFASVMYLLATFRSVKTLGFFFARTHRLAHEMEQLARTDFLTTLANRRAFFEASEETLALARRHDHPVALAMLDIDHFKVVNDTFGHAAGDVVIRSVAALIRESLRSTDLAGRLGGEEFAVLLPETSLEGALVLAERLRANVQAMAIEHEDQTLLCTASIGIAALEHDEKLERLIARADAALYAAKHAGRNRVEMGSALSQARSVR